MSLHELEKLGDQALLVAYANGSPKATVVLTKRLMPKIFAQAFHRLQSITDAEDVTQESFLRLWMIAPKWRKDEAKVTTWLYRVVENLCTDRLRKRPTVGLEGLPEIIDVKPSAMSVLGTQEQIKALHKALRKLPDRQRQAVQMRHLDEFSNPEIAQTLKTSVEGVESLISRGKQKLRILLAGNQIVLGDQDETL